MSNLVPERRVDKNGVWATRYVRAASVLVKEPIPLLKLESDSTNARTDLITNITRALVNTLLAEGHDLGPVRDVPFDEACAMTLSRFSDKTLNLMAEYGDFTTKRDFQWDYECFSILVSAGANEGDFRRTMSLMEWLFTTHDMSDPDMVVASCLPLRLYDKHIKKHVADTGITLKSFDDCIPYYQALTSTVLALEDVVSSKAGEVYYDAYGHSALDEEFNPPFIDDQVAENPSAVTNSLVISDEKIIALVIENVDRGDEIAKFIAERREINPMVIGEYLNSHHGAIAAGSL